MKLSSCLLGSVFILLGLCGTNCSTPGSAAPAASNSGRYYVVSPRKALFFRYGPQQANGPDEKLPQGTLVTVIGLAFGYSKIQLSNGLQGYVASQDIQAASPELVQAATNPHPTSTSESNRQGRFRHNIVDPRFLPPPPPLPEDQPEPTP